MFKNVSAASSKFIAFSTIVAALGLVAAYTQGQPQSTASAGASRVAVLDLVRVFNETAIIQDLNDNIRQKNDEYAKEASQRKKVIDDKQMELTAFKVGTPDHESRRKNLIRLNIEANVWVKASEQEIDQQRFDWTKIVYEKAMKLSAEIAKERGYDLVLQKTEWKPAELEQSLQALRRLIQDRTVIYHAADNDITDTVIQRMDRQYKADGGKSTLGSNTKSTAP